MIALYFLSLFCLAQSATLVRWAAAPPEIISFWRLLVSALILLPFAWHSGGLRTLKAAPHEHLPAILWSAVFFFAHLWTYVFSAQNTRIAHCMILFATVPLWVALGAWLFFRESFTRRLFLAYLLALFGILQLVGHSLRFEPAQLAGDLSALLSAVFCAGYILTGKKARRGTSNTTYSGVVYAVTGLLFGATALIRGLPFTTWGPVTWWGIAGTILLPTLMGHLIFSWLLSFMNINRMTLGKLIEPVIASLTAVALFNEPITQDVLIAFFFTALAVVVLFAPRSCRFLHSSTNSSER